MHRLEGNKFWGVASGGKICREESCCTASSVRQEEWQRQAQASLSTAVYQYLKTELLKARWEMELTGLKIECADSVMLSLHVRFLLHGLASVFLNVVCLPVVLVLLME